MNAAIIAAFMLVGTLAVFGQTNLVPARGQIPLIQPATTNRLSTATTNALALAAELLPPATVLVPTPANPESTRTKGGMEIRGILVGRPRLAGQRFNPLQLINPFAPPEYGSGAPAVSRAPPHAFRDYQTDEPTGIIVFGVSR